MKDYILVKDSEESMSETGFVADFWTQRWQEIGMKAEVVLSSASRVPLAQEYKLMSRLLRESSRILDGACGFGDWTVFLSNKGNNVTGIDISEPVINSLKNNFPRLDFRVADLRAMPFRDEEFGVVFSWGPLNILRKD